jgi:E3 ubiquitin-protein ligase UBR7
MLAKLCLMYVLSLLASIWMSLSLTTQSIESCTKPLGRLRQAVFACLTCNPAPSTNDSKQSYDSAAGICYACSVQCHGEHTLVELFNKRNFTCDCGTTRFPTTSPCCLRVDPKTNTKGSVHSEVPDVGNKYNQNFLNRFCGCALDYDPFQQKGTMFQCLGLGTHETGGCGEDWWHPGCVVGLGPKWFEKGDQSRAAKVSEHVQKGEESTTTGVPDSLPTISETAEDDEPATETLHSIDNARAVQGSADGDHKEEEDEPPMPPGFPNEGDFDGFICYKCVDAFSWIRQYAGARGFLPAVLYRNETDIPPTQTAAPPRKGLLKRKADDNTETGVKRARSNDQEVASDEMPAEKEFNEIITASESVATPPVAPACKRTALPPPPAGQFSLFFTEDFREYLCRCADCFPLLTAHPQLLEPEETYEPPVSEDGDSNAEGGGAGSGSHGSGSLYERGESALRNVDRVRAIEGVMAYNHLKDKLKPFFQQFAESGQAISAEDIKSYFAKLRGDEQAIREAGEAARSDDNRREQSGY